MLAVVQEIFIMELIQKYVIQFVQVLPLIIKMDKIFVQLQKLVLSIINIKAWMIVMGCM